MSHATLISVYIVPEEHLNTAPKDLPLDTLPMELSVVVEGHLNATSQSLTSIPQMNEYLTKHKQDDENIFIDILYLKLDDALDVNDLTESYFDEAYNDGLIKVVSKSGIFMLSDKTVDLDNKQLVSICNCTLLPAEFKHVDQLTDEVLEHLPVDIMFEVEEWVSLTESPNVFDVAGVTEYLGGLRDCAGRIVVIEVIHVAVNKDVNLATAGNYIDLIEQKKALVINMAVTSLMMGSNEEEIIDTMTVE